MVSKMEDKVNNNIFSLPHFKPRRLFHRSSFSRHHSEVSSTPYAAHGVSNTITPIDYSTEDDIRVGVTSLLWPSWAIPFLHPRFKLLWIIIMDESWVDIVRRSFPSILVLYIDDVDPDRLLEVDVLAYNGPICSKLTAPNFAALCLFDWNFRAKLWKDWKISSQSIKHSKCGGVSDFVGIIKVAIHKDMCETFQLPSQLIDIFPASDLGAILNHTEKGIELECAPRLPQLALPVVAKVTHGCFHPRGLFPTESIDPCFVIPCVFAKSRWVKRRLSTVEKLGVFDVPISIIQLLSHSDKRMLSNVNIAPTKCLTALVHGLFLNGTIKLAGGGIKGVSSDERRDSDKPELVLPDPRKANNESHIPGAWMPNQMHNKNERAAKNDDAEVPLHFWNDSLAAKLELQSLNGNQTKALEKLRTFIVTRVWRRNVTRCFCSYVRCKPCHIKRLENKFNYKSFQTKFSCKRCKQHRICLAGREVEWTKNKYNWKGEEGRKVYKKWYKIYRKMATKGEAREIELDIEVGIDCIRRVIGCTAWNWAKGSRLFFWRWGDFIKEARDGSKIFVQGKLPNCKIKQKAPKSADTLLLVQKKLNDVRDKGYIGQGRLYPSHCSLTFRKGITISD